jgi:HD-like signal output (HDOD) protein
MEFSALFKTSQNLPSLPEVVHELIASFNRADVSIDEVITHVRADQALCAKLLRAANSAQFGLPRRVASIDDAVMLLGFNNLRTIVIGCGLAGSARPVQGLDLNGFWRYSIQCAAASRWVADRSRQDAAVAFTVGMMHAIGQLIMHTAMPEEMEALAADVRCGDALRAEKERECFGYDYHRVSAELASRWHFPEAFVDAMRDAEVPPDSNRMACVLNLGVWAVRNASGKVSAAGRARCLPRLAMIPLGLNEDTVLRGMPQVSELTEGLQGLAD